MKITLKSADKSDWDFIYDLRTNENYKNNFCTQDFFSKSQHYDYLSKQEASSNFIHWMIIFEDLNVGYVRILDNDVSIIIDPKYQEKGIGSQALMLVEQEAKKIGIDKLVGRVLVHNESSRKIFEKNGYDLTLYWLEKNI